MRPGNAPLSTYSTASISNLPETQERRPWKKGDTIVEPQGMYQLPNGKIFMGNECSET
ncbi:filamentous hemagglutinin-like protein [Calothrix sp. NIES-4071]|nr:filamentous hemagglutinin-like protein [Calothrix sp. NIES-4071]BAZ57737.1 filamentous hemagglutinin-like protein [Calothrix sp. NIES-4105]